MTSVWRGRITFGLVSIPVRLVKAARRERARFRRVQRNHRTDSKPAYEPEFSAAQTPAPGVLEFPGPAADPVVRVKNMPVSALTDTPVQPAEILKGFEVAKDEFVVLEPDEVAAIRPRTSSEIEITEFTKVEEIDPLYYDTSYYVVPEPGAERAYTLLFEALRETRSAGTGVLAMHGREHVVAIRAGREALVLHTMFYANEVSGAAYRVQGEPANGKELDLAKMLVGMLEARFEPEKWKDRYEEKLRELIDSRPPVASVDASQSGEARQPPAGNIMEALRKSLEMLRKPVASEQQPVKPNRRSAKRK